MLITWGGFRVLRIVLVLVVLLLLWEGICHAYAVPEFILPSPTRILASSIGHLPSLVVNAGYTLYETLLGFFLAVVVSIVLAGLIVSSRFLEDVLNTLLVLFNSVPKVAVAPLFLIWLGTSGPAPKVAVAMTLALFVIVINLVLGLRSVDPEMVDFARSLRSSKLRILLKVNLPYALPYLFSGMKVGITLALIGAIVGEFLAANNGLGFVILSAQGQFDIPLMFAAVITLAIMGTILFFVIDLVERFAVPWHVSHRKDQNL